MKYVCTNAHKHTHTHTNALVIKAYICGEIRNDAQTHMNATHKHTSTLVNITAYICAEIRNEVCIVHGIKESRHLQIADVV